MNELFADSFYFIARLGPDDRWHKVATAFPLTRDTIIVTTEWILVEIADAFSKPGSRAQSGNLIQRLRGAASITIVPANPVHLSAGLDLYISRPDKDWSLTDCISFIIMRERGLKEALTGDHHFEQAGFKALLIS